MPGMFRPAPDNPVLASDFRIEPYWWKAAPRRASVESAIPATIDVAIVGSGFTGASAALTLARAGRSVAILEAGELGQGASSRNFGMIGRTLKHSFPSLLLREGEAKARAFYAEARAAFDYVLALIAAEGIDCHLHACGRFVGATSPRQYETMARDLEIKRRHLGDEFEMVPRSQQSREIASERYHGGSVIPDHCMLHPGLYINGILDRGRAAGALGFANTPALNIRRDSGGFEVLTSAGVLRAREVIVATNGYTGKATPALQRRAIPFNAFMAATELMPLEAIQEALPGGRGFNDSNNNVDYVRQAPDEPRLLFGALTGSDDTNLVGMAERLHVRFVQMLPHLRQVRFSRVWSGRCAATFDLWPHIGRQPDGVHYAMGYCFAGLPMGTWFGRKLALRILGQPDASSVFDSRPFPTRFFYRRRPWFVPLAMAYYDWRDRRNF